jgi:hypothetical protein
MPFFFIVLMTKVSPGANLHKLANGGGLQF